MTRHYIITVNAANPPTVEPLVSRQHRTKPDECRTCHQDIAGAALTSLAYVWETCECGAPEYPHLVEQPYHRSHVPPEEVR